MANPTTNYGFVLPTSTDLVTDLPADFDVALQGVDTRLKALNPSTTLGDTDYASATANTNTRLPIGSNGQVLTVASGVPSWATPSTGGMTLISTTALTGSSVVLSDIPQTFVDLYLVVRNFRPVTDNQRLSLRFNGVTSAAYNFHGSYTATDSVGFGDTYISISGGADDGGTATQSLGQITITDYTNATTFKTILGYYLTMNATTATNINNQFSAGYHNNTAAVTSITLFCPSGNLSAGSALLYGVK